MLALKPTTEATKGVLVSCSPRRTPVTARTTSIDGMPIADTRRYVTACARAAGDAPNRAHRGAAYMATPAPVTMPITTASHIPSTPAPTAPRSEPAPTCRATIDVVP